MEREHRHVEDRPVDPVDEATRNARDERDTRDARTGAGDVAPRTWEDAEERTREFEALLDKYDGDFQKATDAQLRGERVDTSQTRGSASIF